MAEPSTVGSVSRKMKQRLMTAVLVGSVSMFVLIILSMCCGTVNYSLSTVIDSISSIMGNGVQSGVDRTIYNLRLPRVLATFAVGAGLAMAGVVFQAIIRNPLVDPYMTGVSSGAGLGASLYMVFFASAFTVGGNFAMPTFAFVFAAMAFFLTFTVSKISGNSNTNFVLAGVITAMGFSALTTILMLTNEEKTHGILGFLYGSFSTVSWETATIMLIPVLVISLVFIIHSRTFNVVLLGKEQSMELGVNYDRFRLLSMLLASFLTAICVSFVGIIGFVGLIVPHIARMAFGGDHRLIMPVSMILGAILLSVADILIKEIICFTGTSVPIGAITTLVGVPFFVYIMKRRGRTYA